MNIEGDIVFNENELLIKELKDITNTLDKIENVRATCIIQNKVFIIDVYKNKQLLFACASEINECMLKNKIESLKRILERIKE